MDADDAAALSYAIRIDAPREVVYAHLTQPGLIVRWLGRAARGDARPGGAWTVDVNGVDTVSGEYLVTEPPARLVFTWRWASQPGDAFPSTVEITLEEAGDGGTLVHLVHRGLPPELRDGHDGGWRHYLERLETAATGGDPGPDPLGTPSTRHGAPGP